MFFCVEGFRDINLKGLASPPPPPPQVPSSCRPFWDVICSFSDQLQPLSCVHQSGNMVPQMALTPCVQWKLSVSSEMKKKGFVINLLFDYEVIYPQNVKNVCLKWLASIYLKEVIVLISIYKGIWFPFITIKYIALCHKNDLRKNEFQIQNKLLVYLIF